MGTVLICTQYCCRGGAVRCGAAAGDCDVGRSQCWHQSQRSQSHTPTASSRLHSMAYIDYTVCCSVTRQTADGRQRSRRSWPAGGEPLDAWPPGAAGAPWSLPGLSWLINACANHHCPNTSSTNVVAPSRRPRAQRPSHPYWPSQPGLWARSAGPAVLVPSLLCRLQQ